MDPYESLRLLLQAIAARDADEVREHAENMAAWLERGGFTPIASVTQSVLEDHSERWVTVHLSKAS